MHNVYYSGTPSIPDTLGTIPIKKVVEISVVQFLYVAGIMCGFPMNGASVLIREEVFH